MPLQKFNSGVDVMNTAGIGISKDKSMVAVARPFGEIVSKICEYSSLIPK